MKVNLRESNVSKEAESATADNYVQGMLERLNKIWSKEEEATRMEIADETAGSGNPVVSGEQTLNQEPVEE